VPKRVPAAPGAPAPPAIPAAPRVDALRAVLGPEGDAVGDAALALAVTHRSWAYEHGGVPTNERLEFLGDAVLGLVVTDALFRRHPDLPEGQLAKLRASVVNMRALADVARGIGLGEHLLLGRGEEATGGRDKPSILADTLEAVIGMIFCEAGLGAAAVLVHRLLDPVLAEAPTRGAGLDWKTSLQELASAVGEGPPGYAVEESGPDHAKRFLARALVAGASLGTGAGGTKKEAEQRAAQAAYVALRARQEA